MSERAQALEAALDAADRLMAQYSGGVFPVKAWQGWRREHRAALCDEPGTTPPVGVSPQPTDDDVLDAAARHFSAMGWYFDREYQRRRIGALREEMRMSASLAPVEPTPDAQVCVWREREWDYESGCRGTQISRDERSSGPPDGWKHCPYCGKRLEVGTAPQGGEQ